jgi:hypothetical protein
MPSWLLSMKRVKYSAAGLQCLLWEKKKVAKTITISILKILQIQRPSTHQGTVSKPTWMDTKVKLTL